MRSFKAFTLVELLVVIAIIAVLMALLVPAMAGVKELARRIQCGSNLKGIAMTIGMYSQMHDDSLLPTFAAHPYTAYRPTYTAPGKPFPYAPIRLAALVESRLIDNPATLYCPATVHDDFKYINYTPWPSFFVGSSGNAWVRSGYGYVPLSREHDETPERLPLTARKFTDLSPRYPLVTDVIWELDKLNHTVEGRTRGVFTAWPDGHVHFSTSQAAFEPDLWPGGYCRPENTRGYIRVMMLLEP